QLSFHTDPDPHALHSLPPRRSSDLDDHMPAAGVRGLAEKTVVQLLGAVARRRSIEDVPGHQQYIHALLPKGFDQPVEKGLELPRSEEHTSELQSRENLVCRLLLEKK